MNRPFPRLEVLGLTAALAVAGACTPNNVGQTGRARPDRDVSGREQRRRSRRHHLHLERRWNAPPERPTGGMCDPTAAATCRQTAASNWCQCVANPARADAGLHRRRHARRRHHARRLGRCLDADRDFQLPSLFAEFDRSVRVRSAARHRAARPWRCRRRDHGRDRHGHADARGTRGDERRLRRPTGAPTRSSSRCWATFAPTAPACCFRPPHPPRPDRPSRSPSTGPRSAPRTARRPSPAWALLARGRLHLQPCSSTGSVSSPPTTALPADAGACTPRADHGDPGHDAGDRHVQRRRSPTPPPTGLRCDRLRRCSTSRSPRRRSQVARRRSCLSPLLRRMASTWRSRPTPTGRPARPSPSPSMRPRRRRR